MDSGATPITPEGPQPSLPVPVAPLITERERAFATAFVEVSLEQGTDDNRTALLAYFRAFPRADIDAERAGRMTSFLKRRPAVRELIAHLRHELSFRSMAPASRVIEELERIAFSNLLDYGRVDDQGQFHVDLSRLTHRTASALQEVEVKERIIGDTAVLERKTKIKLSKDAALDRLARVHGLYQDDLLRDLTVEMLDRAISRMRAKLPGDDARVIEGRAA